jgi:catechol 2,3-dioxygenase-like lactoylglutathione lyase family enzyme
MILEDATVIPSADRKSVIKPYALTHGTNDVYSLKETRPFYEDFLGLEVVRHAPPGMLFRCGMKFHVVCIEVGDLVAPKNLLQHWGLDVSSRQEVDDAWHKAHELKDKYKIKQILPIEFQHGVYSFYFEDMNHTWWEIEYYDGYLHDDFFDFGDRFPADFVAAKPDAKP